MLTMAAHGTHLTIPFGGERRDTMFSQTHEQLPHKLKKSSLLAD